MLAKKIIRLCAVLVLSGVSSIAMSQTLTFGDAIRLIDENGHAVIPSNYTHIGESAFKATNLKTVDIPDSVSSIGVSAFQNSELSSIFCLLELK